MRTTTQRTYATSVPRSPCISRLHAGAQSLWSPPSVPGQPPMIIELHCRLVREAYDEALDQARELWAKLGRGAHHDLMSEAAALVEAPPMPPHVQLRRMLEVGDRVRELRDQLSAEYEQRSQQPVQIEQPRYEQIVQPELVVPADRRNGCNEAQEVDEETQAIRALANPASVTGILGVALRPSGRYVAKSSLGLGRGGGQKVLGTWDRAGQAAVAVKRHRDKVDEEARKQRRAMFE